jgi:hypothetical protein
MVIFSFYLFIRIYSILMRMYGYGYQPPYPCPYPPGRVQAKNYGRGAGSGMAGMAIAIPILNIRWRRHTKNLEWSFLGDQFIQLLVWRNFAQTITNRHSSLKTLSGMAMQVCITPPPPRYIRIRLLAAAGFLTYLQSYSHF